jgi:transposase
MNTKDARSLSQEAQEALRLRVVEAINDGMRQVEAVKVFGVSRAAVAGWMARHRAGGMKALAAGKKGRPPQPSRLKGWQAAQIVRAITDKTPDQLKLPFVLWTRAAVAQLIEERFGVSVSLMTVGRWLKRWGLTPQKPKRRAWEQDSAQVKQWLEVEYPRVAAEAKREGAEIHWGDEMGLRSDHQAGTTYGRKGRTPVIPGTGQRWRCNMISSITGRGTLRFMVFKQRFIANVFIDFLGRLVRSTKQKVYLIVDGHPVHKSRAVRDWLATREAQIRLILLPAYSPDMNPDEFLNHDVKQNAVGRRRATSREEMMADVRGYLRSTQRQPRIVKKYFHAPSVRYAMMA